MTLIYKILPRAAWKAAEAAGSFAGSPVDRKDGYIHFSTAAQAQETARKHFAGQEGLVVLAVRADALGAALKWEPSRDGALFPHLYGELPARFVAAVHDAPLDADGIPVIPPLQA